ncbi:MAG: tetratricopeptide repeat protein [SAR202 cluster bacterium]|nr:tetratricopeptide repeat protein [SAR202 cluster bacterium]
MTRWRILFARLFGRGRAMSAEEAAALAIERYRAGVDAYQQRKFRQAVRDFTVAIYLAPGHAGMYQHRGGALAELGRLPQAINDYDRAVHLNPSFADTYLDRGNAYHAMGQTEKAIRDYSEALRLRPGYPEALANRGAALIESGRDEEGEADATRAADLGIDRQALEALLGAARSAQKTGKRRR